MSTKAISYLVQKGILHQVVTYDHEEKGAEFASKAIGFPLEKTIKTLVVDVGKNQCVLALMPGNKKLSLKRLSLVFAVKRAVMADDALAQKLTGYLVGGISPFGTRQSIPVVMEETLLGYEQVAVNAGQRGAMLIMNPKDIVKALNCRLSAISKD